MKLSHRYTRAYAIITFFVLSIGFTLVYVVVKRGTTQSAIGKLTHVNQIIAGEIAEGRSYRKRVSGNNSEVHILAERDSALVGNQTVHERYEWDAGLQTKMDRIAVSTVYRIRGKLYRIQSSTSIIVTDNEYFTGILLTFSWVFVFLMAIVILLSEVLSSYLLRPFNKALEEMGDFRIEKPGSVELKDSKTDEFKKLNFLLEHMMSSARKDYSLLKEFTENTSHELQTPLAVIKARIESLLETELNENQYALLSGMLDELERLSAINQALIVLAKLEYHDPTQSGQTNISELVQEVVQGYKDAIAMRKLELHTVIEPGLVVQIDSPLFQLVLKNLLSNASRHNRDQGAIEIRLSQEELLIRNTGYPPQVPTEELFGRFKKGNTSVNSIGIGLAIVKKICERYQFPIQYVYREGWHEIRIAFEPGSDQAVIEG